jgi:hypothetical protein
MGKDVVRLAMIRLGAEMVRRLCGCRNHRPHQATSALYPAGLSFPPYGLMQHSNLTWDELDRVRLLTLKLSSRLWPTG